MLKMYLNNVSLADISSWTLVREFFNPVISSFNLWFDSTAPLTESNSLRTENVSRTFRKRLVTISGDTGGEMMSTAPASNNLAVISLPSL